ncbi:hypothetical protein PFFCH_02752 [Plasmodium falciparum FCH/4]|uniref:ENTH domain-containing protein n=1 Tax=Plasmodium falciparum FCH/4 TaxID=1036724 RepID=A0A024VNJ1_PLAFA|nr:hypothetical protein PFFCH_02752 [Plasmodium falciparum FCH/4]
MILKVILYLESNQFEKNLKEALNNKNYGVSNSLLYDLSISTYDVNYYKRVMTEVFKAIQEKPTRWRRIYKYNFFFPSHYLYIYIYIIFIFIRLNKIIIYAIL